MSIQTESFVEREGGEKGGVGGGVGVEGSVWSEHITCNIFLHETICAPVGIQHIPPHPPMYNPSIYSVVSK